MHAKPLSLLFLSSLPSLSAAEDVLGLYIFHRHGDRTAKAWKPVNFTALGADEVHSSGSWYRDTYVSKDASRKITGLSPESAVLSQLDVTSPVDAVLQNSALVFLQGLYPPTKQFETLANGSKVEAPLSGYQYIPIASVETAASDKNSENSAWLQGNSGCTNAEASSNDYFSSPEYAGVYKGSESFYQGLLPVINGTYGKDEANFQNAYTIFDLINVARIHNSSVPSDDLLDESTLEKLYNLASIHEWNLAYNSSEPVRAIAGSVLAGQIIEALEPLAEGKKGPKVNVQFGAYAAFMSFFGLAGLDKASSDFKGIVDYASSMAFELVTNATSPTADDVSVRFYFANGTAAEHTPKMFPLFGKDETTISWKDFKTGMSDFAIEDTKHWCKLCGNNDGNCASDSDDDSTSSQSSSGGSGNGVSKPVAGVIGALVTLVVILGVQAAVILLGGLRLVKKSTLTAAGASHAGAVKA
ncbi:histidine phosphatase superfamily [Fusarium redolens]|uniref:Histidine phosphatase superfamily n=1 Tax=Fusarium redolens TaxID=48865 RepID=A0A9P9KWV8_FUSRE|nr:histidine phosphatase superfamily [Fusarium redolens]KAH7269838.1 histidine phosphatase superfamily [Fusarium redolens]